ncbi:hypothetical protein ABW19_dt0203944 [Dactylella cylindrospora]|nr:hypothetical protein ABW19_dt0203944 [Dactylella cylindrospora]
MHDYLGGNAGSIVLGGVDKQKFFGNLKLLDVDNKHQKFGAIDITSIQGSILEGVAKRNDEKMVAALTPDLNVVGVPTFIFGRFKSLPNVTSTTEGASFERLFISKGAVEPLNDISLDFDFNGVVISLRIPEIIQCKATNDICEIPIVDFKSIFAIVEQDYFLGTPFFNAAYVVFDGEHRQVGIAPLNPNPAREEIVSVENIPGALTEMSGMPPASSSGGRKLSGGVIAAIVISSLVGIAAILAAAFILRRWQMKKRTKEEQEYEEEGDGDSPMQPNFEYRISKPEEVDLESEAVPAPSLPQLQFPEQLRLSWGGKSFEDASDEKFYYQKRSFRIIRSIWADRQQCRISKFRDSGHSSASADKQTDGEI